MCNVRYCPALCEKITVDSRQQVGASVRWPATFVLISGVTASSVDIAIAILLYAPLYGFCGDGKKMKLITGRSLTVKQGDREYVASWEFVDLGSTSVDKKDDNLNCDSATRTASPKLSGVVMQSNEEDRVLDEKI